MKKLNKIQLLNQRLNQHFELFFYYLELLTAKTMKPLRSIKSKITKDENGENVPHLEITEVILVHCNAVNNDYQYNSRVLHAFIPSKSFG